MSKPLSEKELTRSICNVPIHIHSIFEIHNAFKHRLLFHFPIMATIRALVVLRNRKAWDRLYSQRTITGGSSHRMVTLLQAMLLIRKALSVRSNAIFKAAIADLVSGGFGWYCTYCAAETTGIDGSPWVISVVMTRGICCQVNVALQ